MKDSQYLARITKNCGPRDKKRFLSKNRQSKAKSISDEKCAEIHPEATRDYFENLYRNCKD